MTTTWNPQPPSSPPVSGGSQVDEGRFDWPSGAPTPPPPPPAAPPSPPARPGGGWRVGIAVVATAALVSAGWMAKSAVDDHEANSVATASVTPTVASAGGSNEAAVPASSDEPAAAVASALSPAVVQIQTSEGLGSGVIYDTSGLILTNAHVVGTESDVKVALADGTNIDGKVLGADTGTDVAVVQVSGTSNLTSARLATTDAQVGQMAIALGSPFGLEGTVTEGIVSAVNRPVDNGAGVAVNMVQTDAPINPGNSGGALANRGGEVIGINSSIYSQKGENNGIGFAIPIATAKSVADKIVNGGSLAKAGLGLSGSDSPNGDAGAYVHSVTPGGAAAAAGFESGDLIVKVDGQSIKDMEALRGKIGTYNPGETITIDVQRDGKTVTLKVTLGELDQSSSGSSSGSSGGSSGGPSERSPIPGN